MQDEIELLVVIINYKTPQLVIDCVRSMDGQLSPERQVVIVDNCSGDDSLEQLNAWLEADQPEYVELIAAPTNSGFSGGNNTGIKSRKARYYLLTNSDTIVRSGAIETLIQTAEEHQDAGLVSPRLEWPDATPQISCFRYHTPISELIDAAETSVVTKIFHRWHVPIPIIDTISECQWTSFACVLVRGRVVEQIGLMDEGYFLYYEDVDYSQLVRKAGWRVINNPAAHVVHLRGGSSDVKANQAKKSRLPKYVWESRNRYFALHYGFLGLLSANLLWLLGAAITQVRLLMGKKQSPLIEKQWRDIWTNFFNPLKQRSQ